MRLPRGRFERLIVKGALWVVLVLILIFVVFLVGATWEVYQKEKNARAERDVALAAHESLEERKEKLTEDLHALESERGLEEEFRKRFPVVKEGEEVIVLVDGENQVIPTPPAEDRGFWQMMKRWFGL